MSWKHKVYGKWLFYYQDIAYRWKQHPHRISLYFQSLNLYLKKFKRDGEKVRKSWNRHGALFVKYDEGDETETEEETTQKNKRKKNKDPYYSSLHYRFV